MMKKIIKIFILSFFLLLLNNKTVLAAESSVDYTDHKNGTITVEYNNKNNIKAKIAVFKDDTKYYYNLSNGKNKIVIPLTEGNGKYQLLLCKNISGTRYSTSDSVTIILDLKDEKTAYLQSCQVIDWNSKNKAVSRAQTLIKKCKTQDKKIEAIYSYVVKNYSYDYNKIKKIGTTSGYIPDIDDVYIVQSGICYDIATLMAAMLRSVEIPAKVITGYTSNISTYHAWNEIYRLKGKKWIVVDATYDLQMYRAGKKYKMEKDRDDYKDVIYRY